MNDTRGTVVVAVGGNALAPAGELATIASQFRHTRESLHGIVRLAAQGWGIAIVHGNGPQVGDELVRNEVAEADVAPLPLGILVTSTAGWIGYMIQQSLQNALRRAGVDREVITVITQTEVRRDDPGISDPSKPIGHALTQKKKEMLEARGGKVGKDGRGNWRRLAPSPRPVRIVESDAVAELIESGKIVVAAGGGGPPVYETPEREWEGIEAVVDKDLSAAVLAESIGAEILLILTDVEGVYDDWNSENRKLLTKLSMAEARELLSKGGLGAGSMKPKVEAGVTFVEAGGRRAIICNLSAGEAALRGECGTTIFRGYDE
ncbi:MAG: carbamate kinase [Gemmatimonadetes bacterium]|nr:carbamate kinase [Gemmatimonadota bacterium]